MYDILIIGAGPAGLSAAIYGCKALKKVLVLEALSYGGQIISTDSVENYPAFENISGYDLATKMYNQAKNFGAEIVFEKAIDIIDKETYKEVVTSKNTYQAKTVILATGADSRKLGIDREEELLGKGVSYCATCDGSFYKEKDVAVIGGGNTALEETIYLANLANKVYLIHRRDEFSADASYIRKVKKLENVEIIFNSNVTKLFGRGKLEGINVTDKENNTKKLDVAAIFVAVGHIPENQNFAKIVELDDAGYVVAGDDCHTNIEGIFVAGDNRVKMLRQLVTATSDGAIAATEAIKYLNINKEIEQ